MFTFIVEELRTVHEKDDRQHPHLRELKRLTDLSPRERISPLVHSCRPVFFQLIDDIFLLLRREESSVCGGPREEEERAHAKEDGEKTFEYEDPSPAWAIGYTVHLDDPEREKTGKRAGYRGS